MAISQREARYFDSIVSHPSNNHYTLNLNGVSSLSIVSIVGHESLNTPWRYVITFTSPEKQLKISDLLSQPASLIFEAPQLAEQLAHISSLDMPARSRTLYGIITEFSMVSVSKDEARYQVVLVPR
ncbi:hypothetical protein JMI89_03445, partial [Frischella sp. Ac48]|uniref:contractile injection system protein, VgrG/Pvc8 family n=1 Tax=Frischella sp. Ac48 TaxID=2804531 RepID=UPI001C7E1A23